MLQFAGYLTFRIDPLLPLEARRTVDALLSPFKESTFLDFDQKEILIPRRVIIDLISEGSLHLIKPNSHLKLCLLDKNQSLFSFGNNLEGSNVDAVLDDNFDLKQIECLLMPHLKKVLREEEDVLFQAGLKNVRKFELKSRSLSQKIGEGSLTMTSEELLDFTQALVDLEKELIHAEDTSKMGKVLRQFTKSFLEKARFQFYTSEDLWKVETSRHLLCLPRYKGEFLVIDLVWDDEDPSRLVKKLFFFNTLVSFFHSQMDIVDPFRGEKLWESTLDGIPFPVALLSHKGEVHQHNSLFAKLNFAPIDCLKLKVREKVMINDIPYNIFRKDLHHLDEDKVLFVFFTESFFLKGDGNHTPSGQELGIISSSIAHELNNPIAGIQAALSLLMLDEDLNEEARLTLEEMKNGSMRCKQLIETFLGFSRANPSSIHSIEKTMSHIDISYQQAQNLLRFRTVESGIRFALTYSKHSDFRAEVNLSLLTMTFYLILGDLMTLYSHQMLVANKNQIEKVIKGEIIESSQEIQIQLHELNINGITFSKLIQNLLTIENFVLQVSDYSLRFIYNPKGA